MSTEGTTFRVKNRCDNVDDFGSSPSQLVGTEAGVVGPGVPDPSSLLLPGNGPAAVRVKYAGYCLVLKARWVGAAGTAEQ